MLLLYIMVITSTQTTTNTNDIVNKYILSYMLGENENFNTIVDSVLCVKEILLKIKQENAVTTTDITTMDADNSTATTNIATYLENINTTLTTCETLSAALADMKAKTTTTCSTSSTSSTSGTCLTKSGAELITVLNTVSNSNQTSCDTSCLNLNENVKCLKYDFRNDTTKYSCD